MKKSMNKIIVLIIMLSIGAILNAQQIEQFSLYSENNFLINPAEAGTEKFVDVKLGYRTQWTGLEGSPRTFFFSAHTPLHKISDEYEDTKALPFHGGGIAVIGDRIGPFNRTNAKLGYAYHLPISKDFIISGGVHAGIQQYQLDLDALSKGNGDNSAVFDRLTVDDLDRSIVPDLSFGIWGYGDRFYFGLASFQLIPSRVNVTQGLDDNADSAGDLDAHHWLTAGYRFTLDSEEKWNLIPSFVFRAVGNAPVQFDINSKLRYDDKFWLGFSYRNRDAFIGMLGVTLKRSIDIAYAYDASISAIRNVSSGSHEFILGLRLPYHDLNPPPAQFW